VNSLRLAIGLLIVGCGTRPLAIDVDAAGAGGAGGGSGTGGPVIETGGRGAVAGTVGAGVETGCAYLQPAQPLEDCGGAEILSLSGPQLADYNGDGNFSAGEGATISITLTTGDQAFAYPSIGLTSDNPGVTISPAVSFSSAYSIGPHEEFTSTFDILIDDLLANYTVLHFTACPGRLSSFCRGGQRLSFELSSSPVVFPSWSISSGRPAGIPPCSSTAPASDRICGGIDEIWLSNPRATFWRNGSTLMASPVAWLTNDSTRSPNLCVRAAAGSRVSNAGYANVAPGKSAQAGPPAIDLGPAPAAGTKMHFVVWTDAREADCNNGSRIEFDATVP
jgi:hypothetical protein